ncbi:MAG: alpha/beta hydrolase [Anaerolineales bacterium]
MAKKSSNSKRILIGCSSIMLLAIASIIGLYFYMFSGPGALEITESHPFRSKKAQEAYLALYDEREKTWPVPFETKMVDTAYGLTYVRISGRENAPVLVLLHGAGGNSLQWIPNIAALSQTYQVYSIDNIYDNGRSIYTRAMERPYDFVLWLDELFTNLELGNHIHLVGLSYGGWLTSQYAIYFPERLEKIVMLAPAGTVLPISSEWIKRAILSFLPHRYFTKSFMFWLLEDFVNQDEESRKMVDGWAEEAYVAARSFKPKSLVNPHVLSNSELLQINIPALFVVGENEKIYSAPQAVERLNAVAPNIETTIIPNAGHDLTMAQADVVNDRILEFFEKP